MNNLLLALLVATQISAAAQSNNKKAETIASLQVLAKQADSLNDNKKALEAIEKLSKQLDDEQLPTVEEFALTKEGKELRGLFATVLIKRNRSDAAAHLIVDQLSEVNENRQYRMWKWWEHSFGERKDYDDLTWKITEGILKQFETGSAAYKLAIAEIFGKGKVEAEMDLKQFKTAIGYDEKKSKYESRRSKNVELQKAP